MTYVSLGVVMLKSVFVFMYLVLEFEFCLVWLCDLQTLSPLRINLWELLLPMHSTLELSMYLQLCSFIKLVSLGIVDYEYMPFSFSGAILSVSMFPYVFILMRVLSQLQ